MASNTKSAAIIVREEDLEELQSLQRELQSRSDKARADGRIFMMQEYIHLMATITPEVNRIQKRFSREALASLRKEHKALKAAVPTPSPVTE